ncbi:MAG: HTTM domain-containing protein [Ilumatobacter sp.]|uniref:HTTM domain-containing protein n=1 Tax=Ilumatobacter sp. TaxID=1967498 RepID=UPI00391CAC10
MSTVSAVAQRVDRLLFVPQSAWPIAIARIVIGVAVLGWSVSMMFDVDALLGSDALIGPEFASDRWRWIALDSTAAVWIALVLLVVASVGIIVGFRSTWFLLAAFVLLVAVQRRSPMILNSGDIIVRNLTLLLACCPTSAALSVDRWRREGRAALRTAPLVAPWGLRLVQLQVMVVYFFAFWGKSGDLWRDGTAVSTSLRLLDLQRFGQLDVLVDSVVVIAVLTWGTLAVELALAGLLWHRRARPILIVLGITLHLLIDSFLLVGFFGIAMIAGLMTFLDGERIHARLTRRSTAST